MYLENKYQDEIQIAFNIHDGNGSLSKFMATCMLSILENTDNKVRFHILHDYTINDEIKNVLKSMVEKYNQNINFYNIKLEDKIKNLKGLKKISIGSIYRLYICQYLKEYRKVIYLDWDIIVNIDIAELWNEDLDNMSIAVTLDEITNRGDGSRLCKGIPIKREKYINSGVVIFNIEKINNKYNLMEEAIAFLDKYPFAQLPDQAFLSYLFQEDRKIISNKYNWIVDIYEEEKELDVIYHFSGIRKAWNMIDPNRISDKLFWKYFLMTPWGNNKDILINTIISARGNIENMILVFPINNRLMIKNILLKGCRNIYFLRKIKRILMKKLNW